MVADSITHMRIATAVTRLISSHAVEKPLILIALFVQILLLSCNSDKPPMAPAVHMRDSIPVMTTYGVSKLISDSGVIRYKVVTEEWNVYDRTSPTKQTFMKGLLLEKFNQNFHIEMYVTADTAYWYDQNLWELRGRVCVWNNEGTIFNSELLYWDMTRHEFYSNQFSHLITPDREVEGHSFHSNEQMTVYEVNFSHAIFPIPENAEEESPIDTTQAEQPVPVEKPERTPLPKAPKKAIHITEPPATGNPHFRR